MKKILGVKRPLKLGVKRPGCETTGNLHVAYMTRTVLHRIYYIIILGRQIQII